MAKYPDVNAGQTEACINRMGGWNNFLRYVGGSGRIVFDKILKPLRDMAVGKYYAHTTSMKYFEGFLVKWVDDRFMSQFIGLEVPATSSAFLVVNNLEEPFSDAIIIAELGGELKAEISITHFAEFLLRNKGLSVIFMCYLRGKNGNLSSVSGHWIVGPDRWRIQSRAVSGSRKIGAGVRVIAYK